jgi:large subunit ribosomal protein L29
VKAKEVHAAATDELERRLSDLKVELFRLRFQAAVGQLENPMRIRDVRRSIARVETVLRQREMGIGS